MLAVDEISSKPLICKGIKKTRVVFGGVVGIMAWLLAYNSKML